MNKSFRLSLTAQIFIGLALGLLLGAYIHYGLGGDPAVLDWVAVPSRVFLKLIKMIVGPLIFATLVVGVAGAGHMKEVGRISLKAIVYFEIVTTAALFLGLAAVNLTKPGAGVNLPAEVDKDAREIAANAGKLTAQDHIVEILPTSFIKSMAENNVLQIVVFSLLFAAALMALGDKGKPMVHWCETLSEAMFKFTSIVMKFAPIGVGAAIATTVGGKGIDVLANLGKLVATLYGSLAVFIVVVLGAVALLIRLPIREFYRKVRDPFLLAFTTTSSESALPMALENMQAFGVPKKIVGLVLPLGYSFNLDGTTLYLSLATVFVAQAANKDLTFGNQLLILLTLLLTSKGVAAVPRASLVVLSGTLVTFGLPLEGVALILGVDALMDMARTATNVLGNCLATVVVAKWEKQFRVPQP
jgi:proton glutamate symport protein